MAKEKLSKNYDPYEIIEDIFLAINEKTEQAGAAELEKIIIKYGKEDVIGCLRKIHPEEDKNILHIIALEKANSSSLKFLEPYIDLSTYNYQNKFGDTPLMLALGCGKIQAFQALINSQKRKLESLGYDEQQIKQELKHTVNIVDNKGQIPLHVAADRHTEQINILLSLESNSMAKDHDGNTAAHIAAKFPTVNVKVMKLLAGAGNDPLCKNKEGKTVINIAHENSRLGSEDYGIGVYVWQERHTQKILKAYKQIEPIQPISWIERIKNTGYSISNSLGRGGI